MISSLYLIDFKLRMKPIMSNTEHYYSPTPISTAKKYQLHIQNLRGLDFTLTTAAGVFSPKKLDLGTRLLIDSAIFEPSWDILDLGCGYGVIGISLAILCPDCNLTLTDINKRAILLTKMNLESLKLLNVQVFWGNLYEPLKEEGMEFNTIICNPPQAAGKAVCSQIIREAPNNLLENGLLQVVGRQRKGGKFYMQEMQETFGNGVIIARKSGYSVYMAEKSS